MVFGALALALLCGCDPYRQGMKLLEEQKYEEAARYFLQQTKENPRDFRAFHELGYAYTRLDMMDKAAEAYRQAIQLKPDYFPSLLNLGTVNLKRGYVDGAYFNLKKAVEMNPKSEAAQINLAWAALGAFRYDESEEHMKKAEELAGQNGKYPELAREIELRRRQYPHGPLPGVPAAGIPAPPPASSP
jgi:tetratricopeptide (TPR) repeat protein